MTLFSFNCQKKRHWLLRSSDKLNPHLWLPFLGEPQLHGLSLQKKIYYIHYTDSLIATCWTEWQWRMTAWEQETSYFIWRDRKMNERFDKIIKDCLSLFSAKLSFFVTWRLCFAQIFQWINILKLLFFFLFLFFLSCFTLNYKEASTKKCFLCWSTLTRAWMHFEMTNTLIMRRSSVLILFIYYNAWPWLLSPMICEALTSGPVEKSLSPPSGPFKPLGGYLWPIQGCLTRQMCGCGRWHFVQPLVERSQSSTLPEWESVAVRNFRDTDSEQREGSGPCLSFRPLCLVSRGRISCQRHNPCTQLSSGCMFLRNVALLK